LNTYEAANCRYFFGKVSLKVKQLNEKNIQMVIAHCQKKQH
jgi:hypothetical protein